MNFKKLNKLLHSLDSQELYFSVHFPLGRRWNDSNHLKYYSPQWEWALRPFYLTFWKNLIGNPWTIEEVITYHASDNLRVQMKGMVTEGTWKNLFERLLIVVQFLVTYREITLCNCSLCILYVSCCILVILFDNNETCEFM